MTSDLGLGTTPGTIRPPASRRLEVLGPPSAGLPDARHLMPGWLLLLLPVLQAAAARSSKRKNGRRCCLSTAWRSRAACGSSSNRRRRWQQAGMRMVRRQGQQQARLLDRSMMTRISLVMLAEVSARARVLVVLKHMESAGHRWWMGNKSQTLPFPCLQSMLPPVPPNSSRQRRQQGSPRVAARPRLPTAASEAATLGEWILQTTCRRCRGRRLQLLPVLLGLPCPRQALMRRQHLGPTLTLMLLMLRPMPRQQGRRHGRRKRGMRSDVRATCWAATVRAAVGRAVWGSRVCGAVWGLLVPPPAASAAHAWVADASNAQRCPLSYSLPFTQFFSAAVFPPRPSPSSCRCLC